MKIGELIREERRKKGWTLEILSQKTGLSISKLGLIEKYNQMPKFADMGIICEVLGLDIKEIWKGIKNEIA